MPSTGPKALLLRVGLDRGTGGALGPIFSDGRFEYVPIPEAGPTRCTMTYATLPGRHLASLGTVLPARLGARHPHLDPDFATATYGDAALNKRRQLLRLSAGDLLVFYSGLVPLPPEDRPRLFAVGTLGVQQTYHLRPRDLDRPELQARFGGTAHFLRRIKDPDLALVVGDRAEARLFDRAIPLGDGRNCLLKDLAPMGYEGSILRAMGHWIKEPEGCRLLEQWLSEGPGSLVSSTTRLVPVAVTPQMTADGDLVFEDRRLHADDWAFSDRAIETSGDFAFGHRAPGRRGSSKGRVLAFGRVNRTEAGRGRALSSLYWLFSGPTPDIGAVIPAPPSPRQIITDKATIRRLVAWFTTRYRIGLHLSDDARPVHTISCARGSAPQPAWSGTGSLALTDPVPGVRLFARGHPTNPARSAASLWKPFS